MSDLFAFVMGAWFMYGLFLVGEQVMLWLGEAGPRGF